MDGQFSSGVHYSTGETEVSVSCLPPGHDGKPTPVPCSNTSHNVWLISVLPMKRELTRRASFNWRNMFEACDAGRVLDP